jgi:hypothetical protein
MDNDKYKPTNAAEENATPEQIQSLDIQINAFGDLVKNLPVEEINKLLDDRLEDKKLPGEKN